MFQQTPYNKKLTIRARELQTQMTEAEKKLWYGFLRSETVGWLRQRPIAGFIPDFYCSRYKLAIELDGGQHFTPEGLARDAERSAILEGLGIKIIRFTNHEVLQNFSGVCLQIQTHYRPQTPS